MGEADSPLLVERAAATAETLVSRLETARLWAETKGEGRALPTTVLVGFEETDGASPRSGRGR